MGYLCEGDGLFGDLDGVVGGWECGGDGDAGRRHGEVWYPGPVLLVHENVTRCKKNTYVHTYILGVCVRIELERLIDR